MSRTVPPSSLIVTVRLKVKPRSVEKMRVIAHDLMTASRGEDGCILYHIVQSAEDDTLFLLYMVWRDAEAYRNHAASPYVRAFDHEIAQEILEKRFQMEKWHAF